MEAMLEKKKNSTRSEPVAGVRGVCAVSVTQRAFENPDDPTDEDDDFTGDQNCDIT